jgi:ferredoxin
MKAAVDRELCQGHAQCCRAAGELFRIDREGYSHVILDDVPVDLEPAVLLARDNCPEGAVKVYDD